MDGVKRSGKWQVEEAIDIDKGCSRQERPLLRSSIAGGCRMTLDRIKIRPRPPIPCQYKCVATSSCALYAALIISIIIVH